MTRPTFGSSIICMDHLNFERDAKFAEELGVDFLHLDIMDGNFVPRYGIYPEIVKQMASITDLDMDLHLMVNDPEFAIEQFSGIENIKYMTVHIEGNEANIQGIISKIRDAGAKPGIVLKLNTPVSVLQDLIAERKIDSVMLMGIRPGVLVQKSKPETVYEKARELSQLCEEFGGLDMIQCDGGVTFETIPLLAASGVSNFVCGSSTLYKGVDVSKNRAANEMLIRENYNTMLDLVR